MRADELRGRVIARAFADELEKQAGIGSLIGKGIRTMADSRAGTALGRAATAGSKRLDKAFAPNPVKSRKNAKKTMRRLGLTGPTVPSTGTSSYSGAKSRYARY